MQKTTSPENGTHSRLQQLRSLIPYLRQYKKQLWLGFLFILLTNIVALVQPIILKRTVDALGGEISSSQLLMYVGAILLAALLEGVFLYYMRQTLIVMSRYVEFDLRNDVFAHLQKMSLRFFHNYSVGDIMARMTNDLNAIRSVAGPGIMYFCNTAVLLIGTIAVMLYLSPYLTLFAMLPLPIMVILVYKLMQKIHDIFKRTQEEFSDITTHAQENISGIRVVKAYVQEQMEQDRFEKLNKLYIDDNMRLAAIRGVLWSSMGFLSGIGILIILWLGGARVIGGGITLGVLVAFFTLLGRLTWPMIALGWVINLTQQGIASMGRINELLQTAPDIQESPQVRTDIRTIRGDIEFRNASFSYNGSPVLDNIDLKIPHGQTLAIVGRIGSGKSTLVNLIPRLIDLTSGDLLIDGIPIAEIPLPLLRKHIGYVQQETFLFSDTIRGNISLGLENASDAEVMEAAMISQLYNDVESFPKQFETMLGERGINLSGGQKQRTAISRAVIQKPSILILDDALSAVDTYTEEEILKRLRRLMKDRTSLIVSHRISTIRDADQIIVLENGRIAEQGTHRSLLKLDGIYADLFRKQQLEQELEAL